MGNFEFKKKFGQNFLSDETLLDQIVEEAGVTEEDVVVEIGAGKGALTSALSKKAKEYGYCIAVKEKTICLKKIS